MDFAAIELALRQSPLFQALFEVVESGDYSLFESEAKRQHFVPQFLLRSFATDAAAERVHQLDVSTGANRSVRIDEAASRRWFYAIEDEEGNRNNQIEGFLSFVESYAAEALSRLLEDPGHLSDADRGTLSFFFSLLDQRTPGAVPTLPTSLPTHPLSRVSRCTTSRQDETTSPPQARRCSGTSNMPNRPT